MIRAVFFDAAGTLFRTREPVGEHYARIAKYFDADLNPTLTTEAFWKAFKGTTTPDYETHPGNSELAEREWWRTVVDTTLDYLPALQTEELNRDTYFDTLFDSFASVDTWVVYPETIEVLNFLSAQGFELGVISNFDSRLIPILEGLEIADAFRTIVYSGEVGSRKPHPAIFQQALLNMQASAGNCVHVGDDPLCDWKGARENGLKAYELDRKKGNLLGLYGFLEKYN